jgi:hypothetical protein
MRLRSLGLLTIVLVISATALSGDQSRGITKGVRSRLVGAWRLAWIDEQATQTQLHSTDRSGILIYTSDGHMSVQIMAREGARPVSGPVQYEQDGYEAYYGKYTVDERAHTVTHHVQGALVRSLIGRDLARVYLLSDEQLIMKSSRTDEHWTIAWDRY